MSNYKKSLKNKINKILRHRDERTKRVETLHSSASLTEDLGFDSIELADLTVQIEDEYGVDIFEDGIVDTVGEVVEKLRKNN